MTYIRSKTYRGKTGTISTYYYAVEGHRDEEGKVKQEVKEYLGDHPSKQAAKDYYVRLCAERSGAAVQMQLDPFLQDSAAAANEDTESRMGRLEAENAALREQLQRELELNRDFGHNIRRAVVPKNREKGKGSGDRPALPH